MDSFGAIIQKTFIDSGWSKDNSFFITLIGLLFIFSLFLTFIIGSGSYIIGLESAEQNVKISFIINSFLFILLFGSYVINLFEKKGDKNVS